MKKLITITFLFVFGLAFSQDEDVTVKVKTEKSIGEQIIDGQRAAAARQQAQAATAAAMSDPSTEIKIPLNEDLNNYTDIALVGVTYSGNSSTRGVYKDCATRLSYSPLNVINPVEYDKKKFKKDKLFLRTIKNPSWLYLYYKRTTQGVDEVRSLIIRNSKNKIIYSASSINVAMDEVISPLINF